jgi:hypothetical protein
MTYSMHRRTLPSSGTSLPLPTPSVESYRAPSALVILTAM